MSTFESKFSFDGKPYSEITDLAVKQEIDALIQKLQPLEDEIANSPEGIIEITASGVLAIMAFEDDLSRRISELAKQ